MQCITISFGVRSFPQSMIALLVLNLLKSHDTIAVLQRSTAFDAFPL